MDPSDLRADLAERLANDRPIDAETFNAACFMLSRALENLEFSVPEAAPLVRRLLRVAGRVVIDTATPDASAEGGPGTQERAIQGVGEARRPRGGEAVPPFRWSA